MAWRDARTRICSGRPSCPGRQSTGARALRWQGSVVSREPPCIATQGVPASKGTDISGAWPQSELGTPRRCCVGDEAISRLYRLTGGAHPTYSETQQWTAAAVLAAAAFILCWLRND